MQTKRIEVRAGYTQSAVLNDECDVVNEFDTIGEAKRKAKYYLTDEYQHVIESSRPMQYAQVVVNGECLCEYWRKGYNGEQEQPTRNERIIDSGWQAYAREEGHYDHGDY